ncbi:MAG: hypothetical protein M3Y59_02665 [Myxococcota bacterium]|nr:hypothetical protein [Myxococcota bacterium]
MNANNLAMWMVLAALIAAPQASAQMRPAKVVPALPKPPTLDGATRDFAKALTVKKIEQGTASFVLKAGHAKTTLYLAVEVTDDLLDAGDALEVMMHFPEAGITAEGHRLRFAVDGKRIAEGEFAAPAHAQERVRAVTRKTAQGMTLELAIPAESLPRFPAVEPMLFDLCLTYEDRDAVGSAANSLSNCTGASMGDEAVRLPDDFRKRIGLKPPSEVIGLQRRASGWIGYGIMHYPIWAHGDSPITHENLQRLVTDEPVEPASAAVSLPPLLDIGPNKIFSVLSGKNPYAVPGKCNGDDELRIGLYLVKGRTADRVLEWVGASCALGRASVSLEDDGDLTIGYSNGATVQFLWTGGKFQRTEIGRR